MQWSCTVCSTVCGDMLVKRVFSRNVGIALPKSKGTCGSIQAMGWQCVTNFFTLPVQVGYLPTCTEALRGISQVRDFLKGLSPSSLPSASLKAAVVADLHLKEACKNNILP